MASEDNSDFRVKLTDAYLKVRKVKVNPSIAVAHEIALKKGPAIYPIRRVECKSFTVPGGNPSLRKDNLFNGLVPRTLVFGLVDGDAFNGNPKKNPFNFKHFSVSSIGITVNGEEMPFKPMKPMPPCFPVQGKCIITRETIYPEVNLPAVMPCTPSI
jgi:hypothetical protein